MKKDPRRIFTKEDSDNNYKGYELSLTFPSFIFLIYLVFLFIIIIPQEIILEISYALKKIFDLFYHILDQRAEIDNSNNNGYYIK